MRDIATALIAVDIVNMIDTNRMMPEPKRVELRARIRAKGFIFATRFRRRIMRQIRLNILGSLGPESKYEPPQVRRLRRRVSQALTRSTL